MDANACKDTAQKVLEHLANDEVEEAQLMLEECYELYGATANVRACLSEVGLREAMLACHYRLSFRLGEAGFEAHRLYRRQRKLRWLGLGRLHQQELERVLSSVQLLSDHCGFLGRVAECYRPRAETAHGLAPRKEYLLQAASV